MVANRRKEPDAEPKATVAQDPLRPEVERARVHPWNVPVWALVAYWQGNGRDPERAATEFGVPVAAMRAALDYYNVPRYGAAIDALIDANNAVTLP